MTRTEISKFWHLPYNTSYKLINIKDVPRRIFPKSQSYLNQIPTDIEMRCPRSLQTAYLGSRKEDLLLKLLIKHHQQSPALPATTMGH